MKEMTTAEFVQPFGFGCRGCSRIAETERQLLSQGCEGKPEPLVFASELSALRTSLAKLVEAAQDALVILAALRLSVKWELAPEVKAEIERTEPRLLAALEALPSEMKEPSDG